MGPHTHTEMLHRGRVPLYDKETGELPAASLCPTMDLIAFASPNSSTVAVYRSIDWERLHSVALGEGGDCSGALAWRADGKVLAVGMDQGQVCLVGMESRKAAEDGEEEEESVCLHGEGEVTALSWSQLPLDVDNNEWLEELQRESRAVVRRTRPRYSARLTENVAILNGLVAVAGSSSGAKDDAEEEEEEAREEVRRQVVDVLAVGDEQGRVSLQLFGRFPIGELELGVPISQVSLSGTDHGLLLLLALDRDNVLHAYDAGQVQRHLPLLSLVCETFQEIAKEFAQTKRVLGIAQRAWEDVVLGMKKLLSPLIQQDASQTFGELLYSLLTMGPTYPEQVQLFATLSVGQLQRVRRQIEQTMLVLVKLLEIEVTQSVEAVLFRLGQLLGVDLREVGVSLGWKNSVVSACQQLLVRTRQCARVAKEAEADLLALVGFLRSSFARHQNADGEEEDQGLDDEQGFARVHRFLHTDNGLEKPPLSRQLGLKKANVFSPQQLKQSWDRDFVPEEEEEETATGDRGLFALVDAVATEWKMSQQLVSQALSKTLVRKAEPRAVGGEGEEVVLHGNALAYRSGGELVVETWTAGAWTRQSLPSTVHQLAYCGGTPGKPATLEQGLFLGALEGGNQVAVLGWGEDGKLAVLKTVPAQTRHLARIAASGPRGVCFAVSRRGRFQMLDLVVAEEEEG